MSRSNDLELRDEENIESLRAGKYDQRRFNRGSSQRRSYTNEEKMTVIRMRDRGVSYDEITKETGFSRVNMEKWCSAKGRQNIMFKLNGSNVTLSVHAPSSAAASPPMSTTTSSSHTLPPVPLSTHPTTNQSFLRSATTRSITTPLQHNRDDDSEVDLSDDECEDIKTVQLLKLVMKEQHQLRQARRELQNTTNNTSSSLLTAAASLAVNRKRRTRASAAPEMFPPSDTGYFPHAHPLHPDLAALPREVRNQQHVRMQHTNIASDITMSISDTMLKQYVDPAETAGVEMSSTNNHRTVNIGMATTMQATRLVISNTNFFRLVRENRKRKAKANAERKSSDELAGNSGVLIADIYGADESSTRSANAIQAASNLQTKRRLLEVIDNSDSEQEKEDSAVLVLLGE